MRLKVCWSLFGIVVGFFILTVSPLGRFLHVPGDLRNYALPLGVLGTLLVISSVVTRMSRMLKTFLIITGASAMGWPISLYLHRLLIRFFPTEPVTYVLVFYILPATFIVGVVGATAIGIKQLASAS